MSDGCIDYSGYTLRELEEALAGIDRERYPKNLAKLVAAYAELKSTQPTAPYATTASEANLEVEVQVESMVRYDESGRYIPNLIPEKERIAHVVFSLFLVAYGIYGVWVNDLYVPGKRSRGVHLHDGPAWLMLVAIICACLTMLSVVVDHYDTRDNQRHYRFFANSMAAIGWTFFILSILVDAIAKFKA